MMRNVIKECNGICVNGKKGASIVNLKKTKIILMVLFLNQSFFALAAERSDRRKCASVFRVGWCKVCELVCSCAVFAERSVSGHNINYQSTSSKLPGHVVLGRDALREGSETSSSDDSNDSSGKSSKRS